MKAGWHGLLLALLANAAASAWASHPGPGAGFRELKWGDPPLFYMDRIDRRDGLDVYFRPGEDHRFAGIPRATIRYLFRNDALCRVEVDWRKSLGQREYRTLVAELTRQWGEPEQATRADTIQWRSDEQGTSARLQAIDSPATPWTDYDATVVLQAPACR